jgi:hypothetical protein
VVSQVPDDSLLVASLAERADAGQKLQSVRFAVLPGTWRADARPPPRLVPRGDLIAYLNPVPPRWEDLAAEYGSPQPRRYKRRVIDRPDLQPLLPGIADSA